MSESKFTAELAEYAEKLGFRVWPVNQTRGKPKFYMKKGFADLCMFGHNRTLFVETKADRNMQSAQQMAFEQACKQGGSLYWVCRTTEEFRVAGQAKGWWR